MGRMLGKVFVGAAVLAAAVAVAPVGPALAATAELQRVAPGNALYAALPVGGSGTGAVTAGAQFVDVQIPPSATPNFSTSGCEATDFAGFSGQIAIIQRGACTFGVKASNAFLAGAKAIVFFNEGQPGRTDAITASLGSTVSIPVVFTSFATADELFSLAPGLTLRVAVTADAASACAAPPAVGTPVAGKNVVVAQPGTVTTGTAGADVIYGTPGPDRIAAVGGDDLVFGFDGDDQISGGDGNDTLCGGTANDLLLGNAGNDALDGGDGTDDLSGGPGDDTLSGGAGTNRLAGNDGTDTCNPFGNLDSHAVCEVVEGAT